MNHSRQRGCLNESPYEIVGKWMRLVPLARRSLRLNESPSQKEGKSDGNKASLTAVGYASMKVPPKRKGNLVRRLPSWQGLVGRLNESPSQKEGKLSSSALTIRLTPPQ